MISQVDTRLWRGPRPQPDQFAAIKEQFKSIISLEGEYENTKEKAELAPLQVISYPISAWEIYWSGITQKMLDTIVQTIVVLPKPVLLHCEHGEDRTGLAVAAYRVVVSGWTKDEAMDEALKFGYRNWLNYGLNKTWRGVQ